MSGTPEHDPYAQDPYGRNPRGQVPDAAAQAPYGQPPAPAAAQDGPWGAPPPAQGPQWTAGQGPAGGAQPGGQAGWPGAVASPRRPGSITAAFWLILAAGLVTLASVLLSVLALTTPEGQDVFRQAMEQAYAQSGLPADELAQLQDTVTRLLPAVLGTLAVVGVLLFLAYLWIALKIRAGSRAARTVGTVLAVLSVLLLIGNLVSGAFSPFDLLWVGLGIAGLVCAYRKDATEFMRLRAWERAARR